MTIPDINGFILEERVLDRDEGHHGYVTYGHNFKLVDIKTRKAFFSFNIHKSRLRIPFSQSNKPRPSDIYGLEMEEWCELIKDHLINICITTNLDTTPIPLYFRELILPTLQKEIREMNLTILLPND